MLSGIAKLSGWHGWVGLHAQIMTTALSSVSKNERRIGSEGFAVLISQTGRFEVSETVERLLETITGIRVMLPGDYGQERAS